MKRRNVSILGISIAMLLLILDSKTAFSGATDGISLCIRTVVPSLFPFFVLSILLTGSVTEAPVLKPLGALTGIPQGSELILLSGILGGYPVGAQAIAGAFRRRQLTRQQANRMLSFCSNAGPSFLFGIITAQFPDIRWGWMLWGIHLVSALLVALILPLPDGSAVLQPTAPPISLPDAMKKALQVTASVCGWVVSARVVIAFADRWFLWLVPEQWRILCWGILELTNGCCALNGIPDVTLRFVLCAGMLSFGGLCVVMQTASVTEGLDLRYYIGGKMMQSLFSVIIAFLLAEISAFAVAAFGLVVMVCLLKLRKRGSNSLALGV